MSPYAPVFFLIIGLFSAPQTQAQWFSPKNQKNLACENLSDRLVVLASQNQLYRCKSGKVEGVYQVALGRGGIGKQQEGDLKTPLGAYRLGLPKASSEFGTFIPIAYPTKAQKMKGYTGSAIGIHGPPRYLNGRWTGYLTQLANWTQGCIAVSHDDEIEELASWVRQTPQADILILE